MSRQAFPHIHKSSFFQAFLHASGVHVSHAKPFLDYSPYTKLFTRCCCEIKLFAPKLFDVPDLICACATDCPAGTISSRMRLSPNSYIRPRNTSTTTRPHSELLATSFVHLATTTYDLDVCLLYIRLHGKFASVPNYLLIDSI